MHVKVRIITLGYVSTLMLSAVGNYINKSVTQQ